MEDLKKMLCTWGYYSISRTTESCKTVAQTDKTIADTVQKLNGINKLIMLHIKRHAESHEKLTTDNTDEEGELAWPHIIFNFWHLWDLMFYIGEDWYCVFSVMTLCGLVNNYIMNNFQHSVFEYPSAYEISWQFFYDLYSVTESNEA
jgi:hypothetical protein